MAQGQHEKAVESFQRALRLKRSCLAAWTLMGHEYMELKNTGAAIGGGGEERGGRGGEKRGIRQGGRGERLE